MISSSRSRRTGMAVIIKNFGDNVVVVMPSVGGQLNCGLHVNILSYTKLRDSPTTFTTQKNAFIPANTMIFVGSF